MDLTGEVRLKKERRRRLESGHPWVYRSEIETVTPDTATGDVVKVCNHQGHPLAYGFYHTESQIAVRIASYGSATTLGTHWLRSTVAEAWQRRRRLLASTQSCRAIYGEADGLPGLIVDKYGDTAVVQILSAALEGRREELALVLADVLKVTSLYERSDAPTRKLEGLLPRTGPLFGDPPPEVWIIENGVRFCVGITDGQKTGHFFDQRDNHAAIAPFVRFASDETPRPDLRFREDIEEAPGLRRGARVLDVFCHTGGFALHALRYGASHVQAIDSSERALIQAERNFEANGFGQERFELIEGDAFAILRDFAEQGEQYDVVVLDPPAFAKSKAAVEGALRGYKDIHLRALRLIKAGGYLVTASCSSHVDRETWLMTIRDAAQDGHKLLRCEVQRGAGPDHPVLLGMPENDYLKFAVFEVRPRG